MDSRDASSDAVSVATPARSTLSMLGVEYTHCATSDGGDLYVTAFGLPVLEQLLPDNWLEPGWFATHRERLEGSSTVYRVQTKPVRGRAADLVVKWCRVGEEIPFDTVTLNKFTEAEFNSPYEEFALVMELRNAPSPGRVRTHKPLAIYVPAERLQLWQTGRSHSRIARKKARHRDVELDILRQYVLIYEWIRGESVVHAAEALQLPREERVALVEAMTHRAIGDLACKGFHVMDMKPAHVIVRRTRHGRLLQDHARSVAYALVDFELLERTPEHADEVVHARRQEYLRRQRDRFKHLEHGPLPPHLRAATVLGVDYIFGRAESTHGWLWTVGREPGLFDYFLPERWRRTHKLPLSRTNEVYWTRTKDYVNIVWKVSRVGSLPEVEAGTPRGDAILAYGYNCPFEEFSLALELSGRGVAAVYPRAIYMTGLGADAPDYIEDDRRYATHRDLRFDDKTPILTPTHNYMLLWGYWNGQDELLADATPVYCQGIDLDLARTCGHLGADEHTELLARHAANLRAAGMEDLNLKGEHILLSLTPEGELIRGRDGAPEMRHCNFELVRRL